MRPSKDSVPAHALWVELATRRITTQPVCYGSGKEETVLSQRRANLVAHRLILRLCAAHSTSLL